MPANKELPFLKSSALPRRPALGLALVWIFSVLVSIGFSVHFGLELVRFSSGEKPIKKFQGELKISLIDWIGYYPLVIADQMGFINKNLEKKGIFVELYKAGSNGEMNDLIRTGKVQGTFGVLVDFVILNSLATPIRIVMATDFSKSDVIVARKDIRKPKDLVGKVIGLGELNSFAEYFMIRSLENAGVDPLQVSFRMVPPMEAPEAIQAGRIDASYTWEPALSRARSYGMNSVLTSSSSPELVTSGLAFRTEVLSDPETAAAVILAFYEGYEYIKNNPKESALTLSKYFGTSSDDVLRILKDDTIFVELYDSLKILDSDAVIQRELLSINQFYNERGIRQADESILQLIDRNPLQLIKSAGKVKH